MLGSLVYDQQSLNLPMAAATATFSVVVMAIYLLLVRKSGALDQL
jgi:putative spermidine/putrescine transport system permease protein